MSGGSFNYLLDGAGDIEALATKLTELREMESFLHEHFPDSYAACDTSEVVALIKLIENASFRLEIVWKAVEWHQSCDWGQDTRDEIINKYQQQREQEEAESGTSG